QGKSNQCYQNFFHDFVLNVGLEVVDNRRGWSFPTIILIVFSCRKLSKSKNVSTVVKPHL
ncbi:MAG: hypothetical protein KHZ64_05315, partial [Neisseria mucosa]|nr:hypothetical protein [Neisseria mucosa]